MKMQINLNSHRKGYSGGPILKFENMAPHNSNHSTEKSIRWQCANTHEMDISAGEGGGPWIAQFYLKDNKLLSFSITMSFSM